MEVRWNTSISCYLIIDRLVISWGLTAFFFFTNEWLNCVEKSLLTSFNFYGLGVWNAGRKKFLQVGLVEKQRLTYKMTLRGFKTSMFTVCLH